MSGRFPTADSRGGRGARAWAKVNAVCIHPARPTSPEARFLVVNSAEQHVPELKAR
jgi:hypothetical protein